MMSDLVGCCAECLSFSGFGCDMVDTAFQDDPNSPRRESCCPRFWFWSDKVLLIADIINFILDTVLVVKLFDVGEEILGKVLLAATVSCFVGAMFFEKSTLYIVKMILKHNLTGGTDTPKDYYAVWNLWEMTIFLLEDGTTIYIYCYKEGIFDNTNFFDVANIYTSIFSGIFCTSFMFIYFSCLPDGSELPKGYMCFLKCLPAGVVLFGIFCITDDFGEDDDLDKEWVVILMGFTNFFGYFNYVCLVIVWCILWQYRQLIPRRGGTVRDVTDHGSNNGSSSSNGSSRTGIPMGGFAGSSGGNGMRSGFGGSMDGGMAVTLRQQPQPKRYDVIPPGTVVSLRGLASRPERNSYRGKIKQHDPNSGRCIVHLDDTDKTMVVMAFQLIQHLHVKIHGLKRQPERNGQCGTIIAWDESKHKYKIYVMGYQRVVALKPIHVILEDGAVGRIVGLQSKPELNGKFGTIKGFDPKSGRYDVQLSAKKIIRLKLKNIHA